MSEALEAVDGPFESSADLFENFDALIGDQNDKIANNDVFLEDQRRQLDNPNQKLHAIDAVLEDQVEAIQEPKEKLNAVEAILGDQFRPLLDQDNMLPNNQARPFENPQEKLAQIEEVVQNKSGSFDHINHKFASIQAILGKHTNSSNPWVQAHQSLSLVEESSREIIKSEEKRQKELKNLWKEGMDKKADLYPEMAWDQKKWEYASMAGMAASMAAPTAAGYLNGKLADWCMKIPDLVNNMGTQAVQVGSQTSTLAKKDRETFHDWETQQERQDLETQQQLLQEARQNDNSLKERHLEVIKTLTAQIVGR